MNTPLVLLPGMMCDARLFTPQISLFAATRPVVLMPLIKHVTIERLAKDILNHAPPKFALLGLSMGGIVAMEIIRQAPARVTHLALFDTNPKADTPARIIQRNKEIEQVKAGNLRAVMRDDMKPNYLADGQNKQEILDLCMVMAESHGADVFIQQTNALKTRQDYCTTLKNINIPTLIACGEKDSLCPLERHELMHQLIKGSRLCVIANAGHLPTLEQPKLSNKLIQNWLQC